MRNSPTGPAQSLRSGAEVLPGEPAPAHHSAPAPAEPDRLFLSDYTRAFEIGAYQEEVGVSQRLRFNVWLEVDPVQSPHDDHLRRVINYDTLVDAIEALVAGERLALLETFAERLAETLLADPRARRVGIRLEKLDRLPNGATLGCEIVRVRQPQTPQTGETVRAL